MADPARLVIAEAEPMIARILEHKLRREGYDVCVVDDAARLRSVLEDSDIDVLLLDTRIAPAPDTVLRSGWLAIVDGRDSEAARGAMHAGAAGVVRTTFKP